MSFSVTRKYRSSKKSTPTFIRGKDLKNENTSLFKWLNIKSAITFGVISTVVTYLFVYSELKEQTCVFEYTNIPEEFKKKGFTEQYVINTINKIQNHIVEYEPEIRHIESSKAEASMLLKDYKINQTLSSKELNSIESMNIQGVPFLALIHITDRVLKFIGVSVKENYASLEFTITNDQLHLAILFEGIRQEFTTSFNDRQLKDSFYLLCYEASIFVLEKTNPITLVDYYYNINEPQTCINKCLKVITNGENNSSMMSRAYTFWGLSLLNYATNVSDKFDIAIKLDSNNHEAKWIMLAFDEDDRAYENGLRNLIKRDSSVYLYWDRLIDLEFLKVTDFDSSYSRINAITQKLRSKIHHSELYWNYGRKLQDWGKQNSKWYDTAISKYRLAIELESNCKHPDFKKLSQYYNSSAYAFQLKAMTASGNKNDACLNELRSDTLAMLLESSYANAHEAVVADTLNPYAWSTLGEYYGLMYMLSKDKHYLNSFVSAISRAYKYGLRIDQYDSTEPYCYIKRNCLLDYEKIRRTNQYYSGPMVHLRRLRVL